MSINKDRLTNDNGMKNEQRMNPPPFSIFLKILFPLLIRRRSIYTKHTKHFPHFEDCKTFPQKSKTITAITHFLMLVIIHNFQFIRKKVMNQSNKNDITLFFSLQIASYICCQISFEPGRHW